MEKDTLKLVQNIMQNQKPWLEMISQSDVIIPYFCIYIRNNKNGAGLEKLREYLEYC